MSEELSQLSLQLEVCSRDLAEARRQQTATADILKTIGRSKFDLPAVLNALVFAAAGLCGATFGGIFLREGDRLRGGATIGLEDKDLAEFMDLAIPVDCSTVSGRVVLLKRVINVPDIEADPDYDVAAIRHITSVRSMLGVPLLRDGEAEGAFFLGKVEPGAFSDRESEFVQTFADQAMIAIENVRLFDEVKSRTAELTEALQQQTATSEVLKAISRSTFDLEAVLNTLVESAARLCGANVAQIFRWDGTRLRWAAGFALSPEYLDVQRDRIYLPGRDSLVGRTALNRQTTLILDIQSDPEYGYKDHAKIGNLRTILGVPLLRSGELIGVIALARQQVEPYTDKQVALVTTFADQAVIAIENARLFEEVQARNRELTEALEQQTATSGILRVIAASPTNVQPVLEAIAESAGRLCDAFDSIIFLQDQDVLVLGAHHGAIPLDFTSRPITRDWVTGRAFIDRKPVHVHDLVQAASEFPTSQADAQRHGHRTILAVPLLREGEPIGVFAIRRLEVRPFSQKQIDLLTTFADQAAIAIENVRLFEQVQARTRELQEALEYQTATSDVLNVISRSPTELQPVLEVIIETAVRLCDADCGTIARQHDGRFIRSGQYGFSQEFAELMTRAPVEMSRGTVTGRTLLEGRVVHVLDAATDPEYDWAEAQSLESIRTALGVPLLRDGVPIGVIVLVRRTVRPFNTKQIELVTTFADQAVIAIENARLFEEVQARNLELTETLEQQTATSEILGVISSSPTNIQPVFNVLADNAARLCDARKSVVYTYDGKLVHLVACHGFSQEEFLDAGRSFPAPPHRRTAGARAILTGAVVEIPDTDADPDYDRKVFGNRRSGVLAVPMVREGVPIGAIAVNRERMGLFPRRLVDLLKTFADQAVIAIENVRLFEQVQTRTAELDRSVDELRALGEVSQAVNSSLDLKTVLETIVAKAVQLSHTDAGAIYVYSKSRDRFRLRATYGMSSELIEAISGQAIGMNDATIGEAARLRKPMQVADLNESTPTVVQQIVLNAGFRGVLVVPLLRPSKTIGALVVRRRTPGRFSESTVQLLETFAAQSVLAIQNARLFSEIEEKGRQLEIASRHKSQFLANMSHELRTPLNSVLGFTEMLADGLYGELPDKARTTLGRVQANGRHLLDLINDVLDLSKIEAGQLTLAMQDYSIGQIVKTVASATEPLARAKGLKLSTTIADGLPVGHGDERRLTQVLLNLASNAVKFTDKGSIEIAARARNGAFELMVRDTGPGIAQEHQQRIFEEFQQVDESSTRRKGGTGLGLTISKRIVEMHGGTISVDSAPGSGSTFTVDIPIRPAGV
jgi:GAF domain-containing protein/anti-sigma regulatory factor (Ser/Thr protein kinase)